MPAKDLNNPKTLAVKLDKDLEKLRGKVLFPEKLKRANAILEKAGIPDLEKGK